ncbi:hypothetical protein HU200_056245 [Digitaria exilis]|uniref:BTB domain-containing protein n=1 Tax=Digitaria exilis TaxID=1010633 RepID=A0A835AEL9_9POAL|nr:hypothetical protein HU200_056245 [Digitaria exilis]
MLVSKNVELRASYSLSLVNQNTGLQETLCSETTTRVFKSSNAACFSPSTLIARVDDCLRIVCTVTVVKESWVETTRGMDTKVPPSDLLEHFGKLLLAEEGSDVTFSVGGENFPAQKIVLATQSPVFEAQLYGQMKESMACRVTVEDIQPEVFKALLQFIYTDSLPEWDDRYAMDRLKLLCVSNLVDYLDTQNVATTLALADQHNCDRLKDVCIEFMGSSDEMDAVVKTEGYANLKRTCPSILVDVLEKNIRKHRT